MILSMDSINIAESLSISINLIQNKSIKHQNNQNKSYVVAGPSSTSVSSRPRNSTERTFSALLENVYSRQISTKYWMANWMRGRIQNPTISALVK